MFSYLGLRPLAFLAGLVLAASAPAQLDRSGWQAELSTLAHQVRGVVTVVDQDTIQVDNFYYDGLGISVYFYLGANDSNSAFANGLQIGPQLLGTVFENDSLTIDLPAGETLDGYKAISVWCVAAGANFGSGTFQHPRTGEVADLVTMAHAVDGFATIVDHNTIRLDDFDYDGAGIEVYVTLATENTATAIENGLRISGNLLGMPYSGDTVSFDLPPGETIDGYQAISVWCATASQNFGSGEFERQFELQVDQLRAGVREDLRYHGGTPNGLIVTAYSATGPGPSMTPIGMVNLSQPIYRLPNITATANGGGLLEVPVPGGTVGTMIWIQAYDLGSGKLSNSVATTIQ